MYDGIFSAHELTPHMLGQASGDSIIIAFDHVENKNMNFNNTIYQNSFEPWIPASGPGQCISGNNSAGVYDDCWTAYNGLVEMSWQASNAATGWGAGGNYNHMGPVVWPSAGYIQSSTTYAKGEATGGVRHPHSLIFNNYVYLFYLDQSPGSYGIKVARSAVTDKAMPGTFHSFTAKAGFSQSADSLPAGFSLTKIGDFLAKPGPSSDPVLGIRDSYSFSAAHVGSGNCFAGVEELLDTNGLLTTMLWKSPNLINWTQVSTLRTAPNWGKADMHYPIFLDSSGRSNTEISAPSFYIEGTDNGSGTVGLIQVGVGNFCTFPTGVAVGTAISHDAR